MRFAHEVNGWNAFSDAERRLVRERLDAFLVRVMVNRVELFDAALVAAALEPYRASRDPARDPHCWLYDLLRRFGSRIRDAEACGFRPRPDAGTADPVQLCRAVERDWHALSVAHYQRYVEPGLLRPHG